MLYGSQFLREFIIPEHLPHIRKISLLVLFFCFMVTERGDTEGEVVALHVTILIQFLVPLYMLHRVVRIKS